MNFHSVAAVTYKHRIVCSTYVFMTVATTALSLYISLAAKVCLWLRLSHDVSPPHATYLQCFNVSTSFAPLRRCDSLLQHRSARVIWRCFIALAQFEHHTWVATNQSTWSAVAPSLVPLSFSNHIACMMCGANVKFSMIAIVDLWSLKSCINNICILSTQYAYVNSIRQFHQQHKYLLHMHLRRNKNYILYLTRISYDCHVTNSILTLLALTLSELQKSLILLRQLRC
jgi:hypothetical protein